MALSPMMTHYLSIKEKYKDCVLFYRLGDFYEMFFDDAVKVSALLDLTLTGRDCGLKERAPMCGIPFHSADTYIAKLVSLGEKVAICEQLTAPGDAPGLVERDVVRIISSGTVTEDQMIDESSNNYIVSIFKEKDSVACAWADITTGDFYAQTFTYSVDLSDLCDLLIKINPAEIICNKESYDASLDLAIVKHNVVPKFSLYKEYAYGLNSAKNNLLNQFNVRSLQAYLIEDQAPVICAAGGLIEYLKETQKHALVNINKIILENQNDYMVINASAMRNLEVLKSMRDQSKYGSLLWLLDNTSTSMGSRYLRNIIVSPLLDANKINYRLDGVEELYNNTLIRQGLIELLKSVKDIERISGKISNGNVTPRDCETLCKSLSVMPSVKFQLCGLTSQILNDVNSNVTDFSDVTNILSNAIKENPPISTKEGDFIKTGFDEELDKLRNVRDNARELIKEIENREREATGIRTLKVGFNKVFGYYIEVTNSFKELVPFNYVRKQTLTGGERYITEELKKFEEEVLGSAEKAIKLENEIFIKIKDMLLNKIKQIQKTAKSIACLDVLLNFADIAKKNNYVRPQILPSDCKLNVVQGRHPIVEKVSSEQFIANDTVLDEDENRTAIITGPNMAGKSTYMRQIALIVIMAQIGCFVPCKSAEIPIIDKIFTRVGASDNLIFDQSTFMVEMTEVADILMHATKDSLLVLDEVGRGTSTFDGLSIAWAVVEYINNQIKAKTLFATHYHELSELETLMTGVKNYKITVKEFNNSIVFLRKIARGSANKSFGIEVASLAGVPKTVTDRAKKILKTLEKNDLTKNNKALLEEDSDQEQRLSQTESIIADLNLDNITPIQAFGILADLKEKLKYGKN